MEVVHRRGRQHNNAYATSRRPEVTEDNGDHPTTEMPSAAVGTAAVSLASNKGAEPLEAPQDEYIEYVLIKIQDLHICAVELNIGEHQITLRNFIEFYIRLVSNYSGQRFAYICLMNRLFWLQLANFDMLAHMNVLRLFTNYFFVKQQSSFSRICAATHPANCLHRLTNADCTYFAIISVDIFVTSVMGQPAALTICLVFVIRNVVPLKCYHCQAKSDCSFGVCHQGIACVTATVDRYVSKGCLEATVSDKRNLTAGGCVASRWFGSMATVCYCNDRDFCNGTENARAISPRPPLFFLALACVLFTLSVRIFL
ncbi:hypothetical protein T07_13577 [Trichinella nelsoni]|uniref:Uncharacterized protein n=1 Tax=Trichinella nelsoni TaxID=6336 RepID=A0A0V0SBP4_9BILA|nr:hypothetical protein T07_13577 [Trichinella nelsoni]